MYVPSEERLAFKPGENDNVGRVFVNKAPKDTGFTNDAEGMEAAAEALQSAIDSKDADFKSVTAKSTMNLIGVGKTFLKDVIKGLTSGNLLAWQYHRDGYSEPKWQIQLGFVKDVKSKNAAYAAKKPGGKKAKKKSPQKSKPRGLIS
jgi:hypothetical protein